MEDSALLMTREDGQGWTLHPRADGSSGARAHMEVDSTIDPGLKERCDDALSLLRADLDATGLSEYEIRAVNLGEREFPAVFVALGDGRVWGNGNPLESAMTEYELIAAAAESASDTLLEALGISWPKCAEHRIRLRPHIASDHSEGVDWYCTGGAGHSLAQIGKLEVPPARAATMNVE